VPGFEELKVPTAFPDLLEGIGMTCRPVTYDELGGELADAGKTLVKVFEWLGELTP
jgi:hypothetical protein